MELAQANPKGRRLVLGFDTGCMTCSGLAKSIEEAVGDRLEIRGLNDPMMAPGAERFLARTRLGRPR